MYEILQFLFSKLERYFHSTAHLSQLTDTDQALGTREAVPVRCENIQGRWFITLVVDVSNRVWNTVL